MQLICLSNVVFCGTNIIFGILWRESNCSPALPLPTPPLGLYVPPTTHPSLDLLPCIYPRPSSSQQPASSQPAASQPANHQPGMYNRFGLQEMGLKGFLGVSQRLTDLP